MFNDFDRLLGRFKSKQVSIIHKDKVLKKGSFYSWKCHPFFIEIYIQVSDTKTDRVKLFYPFDYEEYGDDITEVPLELYFDYRISTANKKLGTDFNIHSVDNISYHKFLDTILILKEDNHE